MVQYFFLRKDIIVRRIIIEAEFVNTSPLRIGKGRDESDLTSTAKVQLLKQGDTPVIPGTSWKGIFRSIGERVAKEKGIYVCTGLTKETCMDKINEEFQGLLERHNISQALDLAWKGLCLNCKLFGTMSVSSQVSFEDSLLTEAKIGVRTIIAISRTDGSVARGALATVEFVEPGSRIPLTIRATNIPNYALGYLITIIKEIHNGNAQVGGFKSRGFGFVKLNSVKMIVNGKVRESQDKVVLEKLDDDDIDVTLPPMKEKVSGEEFFNLTKPLMEAFQNAKISYPSQVL